MDRRNLAKVTAPALVVCGFLFFSGCHGGGPNGIYQNPAGAIAIDFENGKARLTMGPTTGDPVPYDVNGDKITIHAGGTAGDLVFTRQSDGSLESDMGLL